MKPSRLITILLLFTLVFSTLAPCAFAVEDPDIQAKAALLVDFDTGRAVYAKNEKERAYPASLTKIMTALLVFEAIDAGKLSMSKEVTVSETALADLPADGSTANIKAGEVLTVEQLLECMLIVSANEAADILAEVVAGTVENFVERMNQRARDLGCKNTHFENPNGYHDENHYTTAWDLYLITREALRHSDFLRICDTDATTIPATNISKERTLYSTNHLISNWRVRGYKNSEAHGIKTGSTSDAGYCLVSSAQRGALHFVSVVLGCERKEENGVGNVMSFSETTRLFNYGFDNFAYQKVLRSDAVITEAAVELSQMDHVTLRPASDVELLLPKDFKTEEVEHIISLEADPVEAPIAAGQVLGTLTLRYHGQDYETVNLLAYNDVPSSRMLIFMRDLKLFIAKPAVRIAAAAVLVLIIVLIAAKLLFGRKRNRYGKSARYGGGGYRGRRR